MRIEDLVPPLELCEKIPQGDFEDSALVWSMDEDGIEFVIERDVAAQIIDVISPAPTLEEIMHKLCQAGEPVDVTLWRTGQCAVLVNREEEECEEVSCFPAEAALKLWLELKGEKHTR